MPQRPESAPQSEKPGKSIWSVLIAGMVSLLLFIGLTLLAAPVFGVMLCVIAVIGLFCTVAIGHYIFWGHWLGDAIRREVEEEEEHERKNLEARKKSKLE
jgi:uncharacterized oligopeptide transporter (OPT) family protein